MKNNFFEKEVFLEVQKAFLQDEVPVGAVLVFRNKIIAKAFNKQKSKNNSLLHAEIIVLQKAAKILNSRYLPECILYVSLEPCMMCLGAILQFRISKVYYFFDNFKEGFIHYWQNIAFANYFKHKPRKLMIEKIQTKVEHNLLNLFFETKRKNK